MLERIRFERRAIRNADKSVEFKYNVYDDIDFALIKAGFEHENFDCVEHNLNERDDIATRPDVAPLYQRWLKVQNEEKVDGTDLRLFPFVSPAQLLMLREHGFFSVEDVAAVKVDALPDGLEQPEYLLAQAKNFLLVRTDSGAATQQLTLLRNENEELALHIVDLETQLQSRTADTAAELPENTVKKK